MQIFLITYIPLSIRIFPREGSGGTEGLNTGSKYACFGIDPSEVAEAVALANEMGVVFDSAHYHIGSGGDPELWKEAVGWMLPEVERMLPDTVTRVSCGGGIREGRMPGEIRADLQALGQVAKDEFEKFYERTGRKLEMEVEPGTYIVANAGYLVTKVIDTKVNFESGLNFLICNGGMECNTRPLLYGSKHPYCVVSEDGKLLFSEFEGNPNAQERVVVGRCCESGDSQSLDETGHIVPRLMADAPVGSFVVVLGGGAYCSTMSPHNYNSHTQAPEYLLRTNKRIDCVRVAQEPREIWANECPLRPLEDLFTSLK